MKFGKVLRQTTESRMFLSFSSVSTVLTNATHLPFAGAEPSSVLATMVSPDAPENSRQRVNFSSRKLLIALL